MMEGHGLQMCGVTCVSVNHLHIMSKLRLSQKCTRVTFREAKKSNEKLNCSKFWVSQIQHALNYDRLKQNINEIILLNCFVPKSYGLLIF